MNTKNVIIKVNKLKKTYEGFQAVKGVSFEVYENEIFGILGPNGAGKTTTVEMMEGIRKIDSGDIEIDNIDIDEYPERAKRILGIQLQEADYFDHLNLRELIVLFAEFYDNKVDPDALLKRVELESKSKSMIKQLSGGQKQRLSILLTLVSNPKILFLDEPTTGLDPQARRLMWDFIRELRDEGKTIILTTHYMEEAELLCDRIAIMDNGKILKLDTPDKLIDDLLKKGFKKEMVQKAANLEDVFLDLTGKKLRDK
ncbi:MAG: ABC transporter ATP-binding protein [Candidatus Dojkabacteria bacterium]|nr:ABC transporter ATP-binding protein [Candidatus Dojkabacteria bacterium]